MGNVWSHTSYLSTEQRERQRQGERERERGTERDRVSERAPKRERVSERVRKRERVSERVQKKEREEERGRQRERNELTRELVMPLQQVQGDIYRDCRLRVEGYCLPIGWHHHLDTCNESQLLIRRTLKSAHLIAE